MLLRLSGCVLLAVATGAAGADFHPKVSLGYLDTDNLTLEHSNPESASVWALTPEFSVKQDTQRIKADAAYRMEAYHYRELDDNEVFNRFDGRLSVHVVPDKFMLDMGASQTQAIIDPQSTIPTDNLAFTANRVDRDDYYLGPSFRVGAGGNAVVAGEVRRTWVGYGKTDEAVLDDYAYDRGRLSVDNYAKGSGLAWAARYNYDRTDYGGTLVPYQYESASFELGFWARSGTRLFVVSGKETPWENPLDTSLQDSFWEAGLAHELSPDLQGSLSVGDHTYGSTTRADLNYTFKRGHTTLSYAETPTVNTNHRYNPGLLDPTQTNDYLYNADSVERYISHELRWNLVFELTKTNLVLNVYDESRKRRTDLNGTPLDDEWQTGGDLDVRRKFGSRTELYVRAMRAKSEYSSGEKLDLRTEAIGASYMLGHRTQLSFQVEQREQRLRQASDLDYDANVVSLILARTFR
jgi:hypothetical protein